MAPIPIKRVVSVSSEDDLNPATNLLLGGSGRKWLTGREEKARRAEVVVELSKRARINSLELSNFGSAFIEVHVSSSAVSGSPSSSGEWLTLLPSCMLMTVPDSRAGRNKTSSLVCSRDRFSATTAGLKWSLLKIICRQPYNLTSQFGLQHLAFYSDSASLGQPVLSPSLRPQPSPSPQTHRDTQDHGNRHRLPSLPTPATPCKPGDPNSSKTPHRKGNVTKQPLGESNTSEEFSGIERQSRLLRNALKAPRETSGKINPILERVVEEREKEKKERFEESYQKRRLLVAELNKAQGKTDFANGYGGKSPSSGEMMAAFRKISRHDNKCEIGQEEDRWSWGVSRGRGRGRGRRGRGVEEEEEKGEEVWVTRRRKKLRGMIRECQRVLSEAGTAGGTSGRPEDLSTAEDDDDDETTPIKPNQPLGKDTAAGDGDSDTTIILDNPGPPPTPLPSLPPLQSIMTDEVPPPTTIPCPLCGQSFPPYAIELHAAICGDSDSLPIPISID